MLRSREIMVLLALLVVGAALVLWYVIDRRAKNRAASPPVAVSAPPVDLGGRNERKTIDFSSGQPVVKDSAEDQAAIDAAVKDMAEAAKDVTFEAHRKRTEPPPASAKK